MDDSFGRNPITPGNARDTAGFQTGASSPGVPNAPAQARLKLELFVPAGSPVTAKTLLSEATAGDTIQARLTRFAIAPGTPPSTAAALPVTLFNMDRSEIKLQGAPGAGAADLPTINIPAGATSVDFFITARNDGWKDGSIRSYLAATATGFSPASAYVDVADAQSAATAAPLVITEVHGVPFQDANGDGTTDTGDQFIEILNSSTALVDLEGYKLLVGGVEKHTFGYGDQLLPNSAAVLFSSIAADKIGITPSFGTAMVLKSATALGINSKGDVISLRAPADVVDAEQAGFVYWPYVGGSNTVNTALVGQTIGHKYAPSSNSALSSPGLKFDGSPYTTVTARPDFVFSRPSVAALLPDDTASLKVRLPSVWNQTSPLKITLANLDAATAALPVALRTTIATGQSESPSLGLDHNQGIADSTQARFRVVRAAGFLNQTDSLASQFIVVSTNQNVSTSSSASAFELMESAGNSAASIKVTFAGIPLAAPMTLSVFSGTGLSLASTVIPTGASEWTVGLNALNVVSPGTVVIHGIADPPDSRNFTRTLTVAEDGGVAAGPFVNEIDPSPPVGFKPFIELYVPTATALSLDPYTVVIYDAAGAVVKSIPLAAADLTNAAGYFVISETGGVFSSPSKLLDAPLGLPIAGGAVAVYRKDSVAALTGDRLLDAAVWGTATAPLRQALLPAITATATTSVNEGGPVISGTPGDLLKTLGRSAIPASSANLRNSGNWGDRAYPTPGYANSGKFFDGWLLQNVPATPIVPTPPVPPTTIPPTATGDGDGDGSTNLMEFVFGTSPVVAGPPFNPLTLSMGTSGESVITIPAISAFAQVETGLVVTLEKSASLLTPGSWTVAGTIWPVASPAFPATFNIPPVPASGTSDFYRLRINLP